MKIKLYLLAFLFVNILFANAKSTILPPNFSISYNSPSCIFAGNIVPVTITDNNGSGVPLGVFSASPAGLVIDPDTGEVNAGISLPGIYVVTYSYATATRSTTFELFNLITPVFNPLSGICQNSIAPVLPIISTNLVTGTWFPAVINTTTLGTITYIFTPNPGQCAQPITINITISIPTTTPIFNLLTTSYCQNATPQALPSNSINGISGTWNPPTINTSISGQSTYVFTGSGQCIAPYNLVVTINAPTAPNFQNIEINNNFQTIPTLNNTSPNGILGTWNVAAINPTQSNTYVFTANSGQCALNQTISVAILYPQVTNPPVLQTCNNGAGFGNFRLSENNILLNPTSNTLILIDYFATLNNAQLGINNLDDFNYVNTVAFNQTVYAKVRNLGIASQPFAIVNIQLQVNPTLQPVASANYANIYVDDFDNVIQPVTLSTIFQGNNFYQWYEGIAPIGGSSSIPNFTVNNFVGLVLRSFKVNVTKQSNFSCQGLSNIVTIGTIRVGAPLGNTTQYYNAGQTLANLVVTGTNIRWYSSQTASPATLLSINTLLTNGTTYYASQTIDGVQSPNILGVTALLNLANETFTFENLKFSPNPVIDILNINSKEIIKNISISNVLGQEVYNKKCNNFELKLDLSSLVTGNYFIKIESDNKQMISQIIKN
jgi:hypothetical protein